MGILKHLKTMRELREDLSSPIEVTQQRYVDYVIGQFKKGKLAVTLLASPFNLDFYLDKLLPIAEEYGYTYQINDNYATMHGTGFGGHTIIFLKKST